MADEYTPKYKVSGLSIERNADGFEAKWKVPRSATDQEKSNCFTGIETTWTLLLHGVKEGKAPKRPFSTSDEGSSSSSIKYTGWKGYARNKLYPAGKKKVDGVKVSVVGFHSVKQDDNSYKHYDGPSANVTYKFKEPLPSTVEWTYDENSSQATVKVKAGSQRDLVTGKKTDVNEHYDTKITVTLTMVNGKTVKLYPDSGDGAVPYKEWTHTFDISSYISNLSEGKGVKLTCTAVPRGLAGDGEPASSLLVVGMPPKPSITSIACNGTGETGRVTVGLNSIGAPVANLRDVFVPTYPAIVRTDEVKLQRRHGEDGNAEDVEGAVDDAGATKLYDSIAAVWPNGQVAGEKIYYRVVSSKSGYSVYSPWTYAECLFVEKVEPKCISKVKNGLTVSPRNRELGTVTVKMKWNDSTDNDGVELSWANFNDAWKSGSGPSTETFACGDKKGSETTEFTLPDPGRNTWFRFRRYRDVDEERYFSAYSDDFVYGPPDPADMKCNVITATMNDDGTEADVTVGWVKGDGATGTEISWAESKAAWTSDNVELNVATFTGGGSDYKDKTWTRSNTFAVSGQFQTGKVYFFRARRYHTEGSSTIYGSYGATTKKVKSASAENDQCVVKKCVSDTSGTGATVTVIISEDNDNTGTEVAWSTDENAFRSNSQPNVMQAEWDTEPTGWTVWNKRHVIYLRGLEPSTTYYVWARRYLVMGDATTYGNWSEYCTLDTADPATATAANDVCEILDVEVDEEGTGATVVVGWTEDNANDGTELSWSDDVGAWQSNQGPTTMQATWQDKKSVASRYGKAHKATQTVYLRGLGLGTNYHLKARRYLSADSSFSEYSAEWSFRTPDVMGGPTVLCGIVSAEGVDGDTARVVVGWEGDRTGCEASWSTDPDAWESSEQPKTFEFDWQDEESQSEDWPFTGTVYLSGLEDGVPCYVRARSYFERDGNRTYSELSEDVVVTPHSAPDSVTLSAPDSVARGEAIECYWSISGDLEQVEWHVHEVSSPNVSLADGEGSLCHCSIGPGDYGDADSLSIYVEAGCGGGLTESNPVTVDIADAPYCECACGGVLESQPASFEAYTDDPLSTLLVTCRSQGVTFQAPDGDVDQLYMDTLWTDALQVAWDAATWGDTLLRTQLSNAVSDAQDALAAAQDALDHIHEGEEGYAEALAARDNAMTALADAQDMLAAHPADGAVYMAEVEMPDVAFVDGGVYSIEVAAREPVAGIRSEQDECSFAVEWAHQAPVPEDVTVEADVQGRSATVTFPDPQGWDETDVFDLYRATDTGYELALSDIAAGSTVTDPYAPFGESSYRVAVRTADGDVAFDDFGYSMPVKAMRFDWPGGSVELPYNVELSDSYEKSFEARDHVDGSVNGYYDRAVHRTGSYQASVVKADSATIESLRRLGEHPGAVFCRTASGSAFQCNADLGGIDLSYASMAAGVSIPITAMRLSPEFMARLEVE